jgi:hypothetical protein
MYINLTIDNRMVGHIYFSLYILESTV